MAKRFAHAISMHYRDLSTLTYTELIAQLWYYVIIISMNNHLCKYLCVSSKAYIIAIKKELI